LATSLSGKATKPTAQPDPWEGPVANLVSLVLADHHVLVAEGLGMILDAEDDLAVLDLAHHSGQAIQSVAEHQPAVLVLDAHLPTADLAETVAAAKAAAPTTKLLVLTGDAYPRTTAAVIASGADGWLAKDRSSRQVAAVIRKLVTGDQAMAAPAEPRTVRDPSVELRVRTLTSREREILGLLATGWPNRRIVVPHGPFPHPEPARQTRRPLPARGGRPRRRTRGRAHARHTRLGPPEHLGTPAIWLAAQPIPGRPPRH
jgi:DNA-binding NarL/FixJ family response regulator